MILPTSRPPEGGTTNGSEIPFVPIIQDGVLAPQVNQPVSAFVFQVPVKTGVRPFAPFLDVAVFHGVVSA